MYVYIYNIYDIFQSLFWPCWLLVALNLSGNETWVVPKTLCCLQKCFGMFSTFKVFCRISF